MPVIERKPSGRHISWKCVVTELKQAISFLLCQNFPPSMIEQHNECPMVCGLSGILWHPRSAKKNVFV